MSPKAPGKINPWLIAAAVILPTFMEVLDTTVVSVSLPNIAGALGTTTDEATWVQTSYLISNAVVLPAAAWFAAFYGRRKFLLGCVAIFTGASVLCGFSNSLSMLIIARIIQGAGGGALQPLSQAILLESFPVEKRGVAMGAYALGVVIAPVIGPVLGGWVTDSYSWRWLFYINLPLGLLAFWLVRRFVFDPDYIRNAKPGKIDLMGFGLLIVWLGTLQTVLDKGQNADWFSSNWIRWFSLISVVAFLGFVVRQLTTRAPLADLRVFKDRNFTVSTMLMCVSSILAYGPMTLLPLFLQGLMGYTALDSGIAQMSRGLANIVAMPIAGILIGKIDDRYQIGVGFFLTGISALMLAGLSQCFAPSQIFWPNFIQGIGISLCMVPLMAVGVATLRNDQMGNATGLFALARNLSASIGISLVTTVAARAAQVHQSVLAAHATPYDPAFQNAVQGGQTLLANHVGSAQAQGGTLGLIYQEMIGQANLLAFMDDFRWLGMMCLLVLPLVLLLKRVSAKGGMAVH